MKTGYKNKLTKKDFIHMNKFYYHNGYYSVALQQIMLIYTKEAIKNFLKRNPEYIEYFI